jgi:hypothetical protein
MDIDAMLILLAVFIYRTAHVMSTNLFFVTFLSDIPRIITAFYNHINNSFVYLVNYKFRSEVCSYIQQAVMYVNGAFGSRLCTAFIVRTLFLFVTRMMMTSAAFNPLKPNG